MPDDQSSIPTKPVPLPSEQPDRVPEPVGPSSLGNTHAPSPPAESAGLNPGALFAHALTTVKGPASGGARGWVPPTVEELQRVLPQYEISEMLGRGGMGAVYKGVQRSLDRVVAIKILPSGIEEGDVHYSERFKIEAKAMARLSHPGIVAVFDAGETADGLLYFVMEFIEGTDVQKMIAQGPLPPEHALAITAHVCDALGFAHESGIVHRDIKPANIMVDARGHVKVADFGLAKVTTQDSAGFTGTNLSMGTPNYMAPEAMTSVAHVDGRADLYAVGVMLYAMLTGKIPRGRFALASTTVTGLDPRFDAIVDKAMQADRENRYASAAALRTDLDGLLTAPIPVDAPLPRRGKMPLLIAAAAIVLLAGGWFVWKSQHTGATGPQAFVIEPGAIKLWDAPEKITPTANLRWENNAVRLDGRPLRENKVRVRDLVLRATVLMNPDAVNPQIHARVQSSAKGDLSDRHYSFGFSADQKRLLLVANIGGQRKDLHSWPMPRPPGPNEWLRLELRLVGDELTASADSRVLGSVRDSSVPDAGDVAVFANAAGYFRDIEYVPLDKAASTAAPEPGAIKLWDTPEKIPTSTKLRWEKNAVRLDGQPLREKVRVRDLVLRATVRLNPDAKTPHIQARVQTTAKGDLANRHYYLGVSGDFRFLALAGMIEGKRKDLQMWPMPRPPSPDAWLRMELRIVGDEITVSADGKVLGTVRDASVPDAGDVVILSTAAGYFRDIEYVPLDKAGGVSPSPSLPVSPTSTATTLAANPANWVDRLNPRKWEAPWALENGVLKTTNKSAMSGNLATMQDGAIRVRARTARSTGNQLQLILRSGVVPRVANTEGLYQLQTTQYGMACTLYYAERHNKAAETETRERLWIDAPVPAAVAGQNEIEWEFRAVGDEFSAWANGQFIASAHHTRVPRGMALFYSDVSLDITKVETIAFASSTESTPPVTPATVPPAQQSEATLATATKAAPFVNSLGMKFVPVPITGGPTDGQRVLFSVWETRVQDYEIFVQQTKHEWTKPSFLRDASHPAINVSWDDAQAFCVWLTAREHKAGQLGASERYRLPGDHEWSCAVGIGEREDPAKIPVERRGDMADVFPWGTAWPPPPGAGNFSGEEVAGHEWTKVQGVLAGYRDDFPQTAPVASFTANELGLFDLSGNAQEWCEDWLDREQQRRVFRGGSFVSVARVGLLSSGRGGGDVPTARVHYYGFRCVVSGDAAKSGATPDAPAAGNKKP